MIKILIAEDDKEINRLLCDFFKNSGYETVSVSNGLDAVRTVREQPELSLALLDLMLPFQSGDMVLMKIREFSELPVIIVSAVDTVHSKVDLIRMGADDYITKPFDLDELSVRVEAVLRRCNGTKQEEKQEITFKKLTLDKKRKTVCADGNPLTLTSKEYAILELMMSNPTKLFSKVNIYESVWNEPYMIEDGAVKVHMSNIRSKIKKYCGDEEYIETIWGMGYRLKVTSET